MTIIKTAITCTLVAHTAREMRRTLRSQRNERRSAQQIKERMVLRVQHDARLRAAIAMPAV